MCDVLSPFQSNKKCLTIEKSLIACTRIINAVYVFKLQNKSNNIELYFYLEWKTS